MLINASPGFFEVIKNYAKYGHGTMLCYFNGTILNYVLFTPTNSLKKVVVDKHLLEEYKRQNFGA